MELIFNIGLWIPFIITIGICIPVFAVRGYKRGLWHSLVSLGATLAAAVVSLLFARLFSGAFDSLIESAVSPRFDTHGIYSTALSLLISGFIRGLIALILFFFIMLIFVPLFKKLASLLACFIAKKKEKSLDTDSLPKKRGGLCIRILDALLFALLLLTPLYGTANAYAPAAESIFSITDNQSELSTVADTLAKHPLTYISKAGPQKVFYDSLTSFKLGGKTVSLGKIGSVAGEALERAEHIIDLIKNRQGISEKELLDFAKFIEKNVIDEKWAYLLCDEIIDASIDILSEAEMELPKYKHFLKPIKDELKGGSESFMECGRAIVDFTVYFLENAPEDLKLSALTTEYMYENAMFEKFGEMFNSSSLLRIAKEALYKNEAYNILGADYSAVELFMKDYPEDGIITDKDELIAEGEALYILLTDSDGYSAMDALARHPYLGASSFERAIDSFDTKRVLFLGGLTPKEAEYIEKSENIKSEIFALLERNSALPLGKAAGIKDYLRTLESVARFRPYKTNKTDIYSNPIIESLTLVDGKYASASLEFALFALGEEYFSLRQDEFPLWKESLLILSSFGDSMKDCPEEEGNLACDSAAGLIKLCSSAATGESLAAMTETVSAILRSEIAYNAITDLTSDEELVKTLSASFSIEKKAELCVLTEAVAETLDASKATISVHSVDSESGETVVIEKAVSELTDEELSLFGLTRDELYRRYVPAEELDLRISALNALFGI